MIKSLIIVALLVLVAIGASASRPSQASFSDFARTAMEAGNTNPLEKIGLDLMADAYVKSCTYKDRLLWVEVDKDNKAAYYGAFGRWFAGDPTEAAKPALPSGS